MTHSYTNYKDQKDANKSKLTIWTSIANHKKLSFSNELTNLKKLYIPHIYQSDNSFIYSGAVDKTNMVLINNQIHFISIGTLNDGYFHVIPPIYCFYCVMVKSGSQR